MSKEKIIMFLCEIVYYMIAAIIASFVPIDYLYIYGATIGIIGGSISAYVSMSLNKDDYERTKLKKGD